MDVSTNSPIRSIEARQLLENPIFKSVTSEMEAQYYEAWKNAPDSITREDLWYRLNALEMFRRDVEAIVTNGKLAALNSRRLRSRTS
jgi:hypothetical protein